MAVKSTVFFDGDLKVMYEVPPDSSFILDGSGYRIYTPNNLLSADTITLINIQEDIWSRGQDWWNNGNDWTDFPLIRSGGNLRGYDEIGNPIFQSVDFTLKSSEGWRIVLANYPHECRFTGNLYSNDVNGLIFDNSRLTEIAISRLTGASDLLTFTQYIDSGTGLNAEQNTQLMSLPTVDDIWSYNDLGDNLKTLFGIGVGNWEIVNYQMIIYNENNEEILRFNLKNKTGKPSDTQVFSRDKV